MKPECISKSIESDVKELGIIACVVGTIVIILWFVSTQWVTITATIATLGVGYCLALFGLIVSDILTIILCQTPLYENDLKNQPAPLYYPMTLYFLSLMLLNIAAIMSQVDTIKISVVNTIVLSVVVIIARIYTRCKDT